MDIHKEGDGYAGFYPPGGRFGVLGGGVADGSIGDDRFGEGGGGLRDIHGIILGHHRQIGPSHADGRHAPVRGPRWQIVRR